MIKHTQIKKVYKYDFHTISMKKWGMCFGFVSCDPLSFYNDISCINSTGVTHFTPPGLSGNQTHASYFGDTRATITLLAH